MHWIRLIGSFIGQVISWGGFIAYLFGIPSPFDITALRSVVTPLEVGITLCIAGIICTGPLLWTSAWWWPRVASAFRARRQGSPQLSVQPTSDGSVSPPAEDMERFRACLPHIERCRKLVQPFAGPLGSIDMASQQLNDGGTRIGELIHELSYLTQELETLGIRYPIVYGGNDEPDSAFRVRLRIWSTYLTELEVIMRHDDLAGARQVIPPLEWLSN